MRFDLNEFEDKRESFSDEIDAQHVSLTHLISSLTRRISDLDRGSLVTGIFEIH